MCFFTKKLLFENNPNKKFIKTAKKYFCKKCQEITLWRISVFVIEPNFANKLFYTEFYKWSP